MAFFVFGEVHGVINRVDHLAKQDAIFHVVVGVGECGLYDHLAQWCILGKFETRQRFKEVVVDEVQELITSKGVAVFCVWSPAMPAQSIGDDRFVRVVVEFPFLFLCVVYFQEE